MRKYRLVLLLKSSVSKDQKEKLLSTVKKWIGVVKNDKVDSYGERKLAYEIKKEKSAEYTVLDFETDKITDDLDKRIAMNDDILRHLVIRKS